MLRDFPLIVADESVDGRIISALKKHEYAVFAIASECSGVSDSQVIELAISKQAFIITEDKDFGDELVYRKVSLAVGSLLLRLYDVSIEVRVHLILDVIASNGLMLQAAFSVLTSKKLRIRKYTK